MKSRLLAILFIPCLLLTMVLPLVDSSTASADQQGDIQNATFKFQDRATIVGSMGSFGTVDFVDKDINDGNNNYAPTSGNFCDTQGITLHSGSLNWSASSIYADTIELGYKTGNNCNKVTLHMVSVANPTDSNTGQPVAAARFQWNSSDISTLNGQSSSATFTAGSGAPGLYIEQTSDNSECHAYAAIFLLPGSTSQGTLYTFDSSADGYTSVPGLGNLPNPLPSTKPASAYSTIAPYFPSGCNVLSGSYHPYTVTIGGQQGTPAPGGGGAGGGAGAGGAGSTGVSCNLGISFSSVPAILNSFNPLNWLLCGVLEGMDSIVIQLDQYITSWLAVGTVNTSTDDPTNIFADNGQCSSTYTYTTSSGSTGTGYACNAYYTAWSSFRDLALGLLVIITLVIVIAQALGMDILDAYTIRKMLPRVVAGAIILTISWPLMRFFVTASNDLGYGVGYLLSSPFAGITDASKLVGGGAAGANSLLASFAASAGIAVIGFFGLLSFVGTAAIAVFVAFLVLVLRQIAIIMLVIFAPVAIIAYALPNTQRVFRFWWESFSKMLLMFPMIVAMITIGHIFSAISSQNPSFTNQVIAIIAYFAPYFMIPFTFRFSGSIMSSAGGIVNGQFNGMRGGLSKFRSGQTKQRTGNAIHRAQNGNIFRGASEDSARGGLNRAIKRGTLLNQVGYKPHRMLSSLRAAESTSANAHSIEESEKNPDFQPIKINDELLQAANHGRGTRADAREYLMEQGQTGTELEKNLAHIDKAKKSMGEHNFQIAAAVANAGTGTGFGGGASEMLETIDRVSAGDDVLASNMIKNAHAQAQQASRPDLWAPGFTESSEQLHAIHAAPDGAAHVAAIQQAQDHLADMALDKQGPGVIASGRGAQSTENLIPAMQRRLARSAQAVQTAHASGSLEQLAGAQRQFKQALASTAGLHDALGSSTPENARIFADGLMGRALPGGTETVQSMLEDYRGDNEFIEMRREYGSAATALQNQPAPQPTQPTSPPGGPSPSDRRLKSNIQQFGYAAAGIPLYKFNYTYDQQTTYVGIMAQDILETHPDAVHISPDGYYMVDYEMLGLRMMTIEEWERENHKHIS
jgi:hypothetical protein